MIKIFSKKQKQSSRKKMIEKKQGYENLTPLRIDTFSESPILKNFFYAMIPLAFLMNHRKDFRK